MAPRYEKRTVTELRELCYKKNYKNCSGKNKDELISILRNRGKILKKSGKKDSRYMKGARTPTPKRKSPKAKQVTSPGGPSSSIPPHLKALMSKPKPKRKTSPVKSPSRSLLRRIKRCEQMSVD